MDRCRPRSVLRKSRYASRAIQPVLAYRRYPRQWSQQLGWKHWWRWWSSHGLPRLQTEPWRQRSAGNWRPNRPSAFLPCMGTSVERKTHWRKHAESTSRRYTRARSLSCTSAKKPWCMVWSVWRETRWCTLSCARRARKNLVTHWVKHLVSTC